MCRSIDCHNIDGHGVLIGHLSGKFRDFRDSGDIALVKEYGQTLKGHNLLQGLNILAQIQHGVYVSQVGNSTGSVPGWELLYQAIDSIGGDDRFWQVFTSESFTGGNRTQGKNKVRFRIAEELVKGPVNSSSRVLS